MQCADLIVALEIFGGLKDDWMSDSYESRGNMKDENIMPSMFVMDVVLGFSCWILFFLFSFMIKCGYVCKWKFIVETSLVCCKSCHNT